MLSLDYKSGKSIHEQIQDGIKSLIMSGGIGENEQLPSVRELSVMLTVNPNTVQKAYKELENSGFIYSVRGKGSFAAKIDCADEKTALRLLGEIEKSAEELKFMNVGKERILELIDKIYSKEDEK